MIPIDIAAFVVNKLRLRLTIALSLILIAGLSYIILSQLRSNLEKLQIYTDSLASKVEETMVLGHKIDEDVEKWNKEISTLYVDRRGLDLESARQIVYQFKVANSIKNLSINITNPQLRTNFNLDGYIDLQYSVVTLVFNAATDKEAMKFMDGIKNDIPGIVKYLSFDISSATDIPKVGQSKQIDDANKPQLLQAKVVLLWQNFDDKSKAN